jgi:hypothetical protein
MAKSYHFEKRMRQIDIVETRFIASFTKDVLQSLIELVSDFKRKGTQRERGGTQSFPDFDSLPICEMFVIS